MITFLSQVYPTTEKILIMEKILIKMSPDLSVKRHNKNHITYVHILAVQGFYTNIQEQQEQQHHLSIKRVDTQPFAYYTARTYYYFPKNHQISTLCID